jgi:hypothetical protein
MAKKTASKKSTKKATKKGERNSTPKLECPYIANATRLHGTESSGKLATKLTSFVAAKAKWIGQVRTAFAEGTSRPVELPVFPVGKFVDPNAGQLTRKQTDALKFDDCEMVPPPAYNPVLVDLLHEMNCTSIRKGTIKNNPKPPADWDESKYGSWYHESEGEDGEVIQEPSGWYFHTKMPRRCHAETAEMLIDNPDENILTFGKNRFVVGTGTHDKAAAFMIWQTSHGNYRAGDAARKRMSLAGNKEVRDIVFKIEDSPNNGDGFTVKGKWAFSDEMVYSVGQVLTAGNLFDSKGNQLDAKTIRGLDGETKGLKFKALPEKIIGKAVAWSKLWTEIKQDKASIKAMRERGGRSDEYEAGDTETKSITNICVNGKRVDPCELTPYGLKGSQINMPAYVVASGEGKIEDGHFSMGVVIGARANAGYNVGVHDAKAALAETEAPKPKKKAAAKKSTKKVDAAPPVEADTADEVVESETEVVSAE